MATNIYTLKVGQKCFFQAYFYKILGGFHYEDVYLKNVIERK